MSPTTIFSPPYQPCAAVSHGAALLGGTGVYPGWGMLGGCLEGTYRVLTQPSLIEAYLRNIRDRSVDTAV